MMLSQYQYSGLYHGTARDVEGRIRPAAETGIHTFEGNKPQVLPGGGQGQIQDVAHVTTDEAHAWTMAAMAARPRASGNPRGGRSRVYVAEAHPEMVPGQREHESEYVAPHFDVRDSIDIKPPVQQGKKTLYHQGTFPQVNWREFAAFRHPQEDPNHPKPGEELSEAERSEKAMQSPVYQAIVARTRKPEESPKNQRRLF